jgi:hypothetical protein
MTMSATAKKSQHPAGTTKAGLAAKLKPLSMTIDGQHIPGDARVFQDGAGSVGYYFNGKVQVTLADGTKVWAQVGANVTIIGTKELPA